MAAPLTATVIGNLPAGSTLLFDASVDRVTDGITTTDLGPVNVGVGSSGAFSQVLTSTLDPAQSPYNWTYHVTGSTPTGHKIDFYFTLNPGTTVNLATLAQIAASGGAVIIPYINVLDFGAIPDYDITTSTMTTDSTAAFQEAIDAANPGDVVYAPAATSLLKSYCVGSLSIDKPITIIGDSRYTSRITAKAGSTGAMFDLVWNGLNLEESHEYGVTLRDLYFDGAKRAVDYHGIRADLHDRLTLENLQIRNFARSAINVVRSVREANWRSVYMKWNGGLLYASVDIADSYVGDGSNNITLDDCEILYSFGPTLRVEKTGGVAARLVKLNNCMLHGITSALVEGQSLFPATGDGNQYAVTGRELEFPVVDLASVRDIQISNTRIHAPGYGQPHIMVREAVGGPVTAKSVVCNGISFGDLPTRALTCSVTSNVFTSSVDHHVGSGALVRVTGTALDANTDYWFIRLSATTFSLAATRAEAMAGTPVVAVADDPANTVTCQLRPVDLDIGPLGNGRALVSGSLAQSTSQRAVIINRTGTAQNAVVGNTIFEAGVGVETV